jgi:hypothetical protein
MASTSAFGWETPDDTDLVKDGAAAIRTLGNSIDTSMSELKGGTTGQVLSKTSNTDMDFTWVAQDDSNAIQNAIVDAKGDLIAASANDTPARLAVGANGETLVADSSTSTGLRYQTAYNGNAVINGGFDIWQRGTSFTAASVYTADRWFAGSQTTFTRSRQASGLTGIQYAMRVQRDSGSTNTSGGSIYYNLESADSYRFAGQTVTVSFYAKAGANYSPTSSALGYILYTGTGTDQRRDQSTGFTGETTVVNSSVTLTTSYQRFSYTVAIGASATEIALGFYSSNTGTASTNDWYEITGVQLEVGSVATTFKRSNGAGGTIQGELAACQRYYWRTTGTGSDSTVFTGFGYTYTTTNSAVNLPLRVTMRVKPTAIDYANLIHIQTNGNQAAVTALTIANGGTNDVQLLGTSTAITNSLSTAVCGSTGGTPYIGLSAEL